jgi:hypothetical protein
MNSLSITYALKFRIKFAPDYLFTTCNKLINSKRGKEVKKVIQGRCLGYNINGRFISLTKLREQLEVISNDEIPF